MYAEAVMLNGRIGWLAAREGLQGGRVEGRGREGEKRETDGKGRITGQEEKYALLEVA